VGYLRSLNGTGAAELPRGNAANGERIFWASCGTCHTVNGRGGPLGPAPGAAAWDPGGAWEAASRWTDERLAAERARVLRRLGRWTEAAEAWQTAAAAGGGLGVIAWIEVAKLREHRLADPGGALAATRAAWRLLERLRTMGRAHPRPRGGPPAARCAPHGPGPPARRRGRGMAP
jgi:hypothetical protein